MPFFTLLLIVKSIREVDDSIINSYTSPTNHATIVALVLTGIWITIGIFVCDVLACYVVLNGHEYSSDIKRISINLYIVFGTLVSDIIFILPMLLIVLYICIFYNGREIFKILHCNTTCSGNSCLSTVIAFIVGKKMFSKIIKLSENGIVSLMFPFMLVTPLLCFSSHLGYVMLAWLTEPSKCTITLILYYTFFVLLFFIFRRLYKIYSKIIFHLVKKTDDTSSNKNVKRGATEHELRSDYKEQVSLQVEHTSEVVNDEQTSRTYVSKACGCISYSRASSHYINTQAFCLLLFYGVIIVSIATIFILIFVLLPITSDELAIYFVHALRLMILLITSQFAYQLFFSTTFTLRNVLQKFKEVYAKKGHNENLVFIASKQREDLADIAGEFAAEFTDVIINKT